jgi:hypothetical protein
VGITWLPDIVRVCYDVFGTFTSIRDLCVPASNSEACPDVCEPVPKLDGQMTNEPTQRGICSAGEWAPHSPRVWEERESGVHSGFRSDAR